MIIFFDSEFTELGIDPKLISIGFISENGKEFYAELTDTYEMTDCSDFAREAVLPQLDGGYCRMTLGECASKFIAWLETEFSHEEPLELATDSRAFDWVWIEELLCVANAQPANLKNRPMILQFDAIRGARYLNAVERTYANGLRRHHALDDAKAHRLGWHSMNQFAGKVSVYGE
jgi:3'-5' exoribonuclease Rv2179c-like domain